MNLVLKHLSVRLIPASTPVYISFILCMYERTSLCRCMKVKMLKEKEKKKKQKKEDDVDDDGDVVDDDGDDEDDDDDDDDDGDDGDDDDDDDDGVFDDGGCVFYCGVVVMVTGKNDYGQNMLAALFWEKPFAGLFGKWWRVS